MVSESQDEAPLGGDLLSVEVDDHLRALLDRYPLPTGVEDADCNQEEIGQALNKSMPTIAKFIRQEGMPVVRPGGNGQPYVLRLSHCWAWFKAREAREDMRERHNKAQIAAMQASFLGLDVNDGQAAMTPQQRKEAAMADIAWSKAAHMRRQLVPLSDVVDLYESILKIVRDGIEALPDRLEMELALKPDQVQAVVLAGSDILQSMANRIAEEELAEKDVADVEVQDRWLI